MKHLLLPFLLLFTIASYAQEDSTKTSPLVTSVSISSKNFWRGNVYGDNAPSISGTLGLTSKHFEIGVTGTSPLSGSRVGYGIWAELYASAKLGNFTLTLDDYYFFNEYDSLNEYENWSSKDTQHLLEARLKYGVDRFNVTASIVAYAAKESKNSLYLEGEVFLILKQLSVSAGGVFGESYLNFFDKGGLAFAGVNGYRDIKVTDNFAVPLRVSVMTSPNYKNASKYNGFTQNPINVIVGVTF
jgi:hypothetical protein